MSVSSPSWPRRPGSVSRMRRDALGRGSALSRPWPHRQTLHCGVTEPAIRASRSIWGDWKGSTADNPSFRRRHRSACRAGASALLPGPRLARCQKIVLALKVILAVNLTAGVALVEHIHHRLPAARRRRLPARPDKQDYAEDHHRHEKQPEDAGKRHPPVPAIMHHVGPPDLRRGELGKPEEKRNECPHIIPMPMMLSATCFCWSSSAA